MWVAGETGRARRETVIFVGYLKYVHWLGIALLFADINCWDILIADLMKEF